MLATAAFAASPASAVGLGLKRVFNTAIDPNSTLTGVTAQASETGSWDSEPSYYTESDAMPDSRNGYLWVAAAQL